MDVFFHPDQLIYDPKQEFDGNSMKTYFYNQDDLSNIRVQKNISDALNGVEAVIFAVPHKEYIDLNPDNVVKWAGNKIAVIDCFGILSDDAIRRYFELGCEVKGLGRGHINRIKDNVRKEKR